MTTRTIIELEKVVLGYERAIIGPLDMTILKGDFWGIAGPNGAGKTTLIKTIIQTIKPISGKIDFPSGKIKFGYVPQRHILNKIYPLSVYDVVLMGRTTAMKIKPGQHDRQRVYTELKRVGLDHLANSAFSSLSGGQQQKTLLARALVSDPEVLILDEPTAGMDLTGEADMLFFLKDLNQSEQITIFMVGHHLDKVVRFSDHLCLINKDQDIFVTGKTTEILDAKRLSTVYRRNIMIKQNLDTISISAGRKDNE